MNKATWIGFCAIAMWSFLATFTAMSGKVPPFQLSAMAFLIAALPGIIGWWRNHETLQVLRQPLFVWLIGISGLFGYHFLYFTALRNAPEVEAGLINYLWPLLVVLGSALMPGEHLRWFHIAGALLGFAGTMLIVTGNGGFSLSGQYTFGYLMALAGAFVWAAYSLLSRRVSAVPTSIVAAFCLVTSLLSFLCHFLFAEPTIWPQDSRQWLAVAGLGLFPVGLAFYCWDYGVKRGNIQLLGAASYAAPVLSTLLLVASGMANLDARLVIACLFITAGAMIAASNILFRKRNQR